MEEIRHPKEKRREMGPAVPSARSQKNHNCSSGVVWRVVPALHDFRTPPTPKIGYRNYDFLLSHNTTHCYAWRFSRDSDEGCLRHEVEWISITSVV